MKRGQVTLFILLGIMVLIIVSLLLFFQRETDVIEAQDLTEIREVQLERTSAQEFLESCLSFVVDEAHTIVMLEGGMGRLKVTRGEPTEISPDGEVTSLFYKKFGQFAYVPYYYIHDGETDEWYDLTYTNEQLAQQLAFRISTMLPHCLEGFEPFTLEDQRITYGGHTINVTFEDVNKTVVNYNPRITLSDASGTTQLDPVRYVVESDLMFYQNMLQYIISQYNNNETNRDSIPWLPIFYVSRENDMFFQTFNLDNSQVILSLQKNSSTPRHQAENRTSAFNVLLQFDWEVDWDIHLSPRYSSYDSVPILGEYTWQMPEHYRPWLVNGFADWKWDISSFFPGADYYEILSESFHLNESGEVTSTVNFLYPGSHEFLIKAYQNSNTGNFVAGRFVVNVEDIHHNAPYVRPFNQSVAYRGYDFYRRTWADSPHDLIPVYAMDVSKELREQPCGGFIHADPFTGEISGFITAEPGEYELNMTVVQINPFDEEIQWANFTSSFFVRGEYEVAGCDV